MRKIKIVNAELEQQNDTYYFVRCPQSMSPDDYGYCNINCAWFEIREVYGQGVNKDKVMYKRAYCKDHCIGEVVE